MKLIFCVFTIYRDEPLDNINLSKFHLEKSSNFFFIAKMGSFSFFKFSSFRSLSIANDVIQTFYSNLFFGNRISLLLMYARIPFSLPFIIGRGSMSYFRFVPKLALLPFLSLPCSKHPGDNKEQKSSAVSSSAVREIRETDKGAFSEWKSQMEDHIQNPEMLSLVSLSQLKTIRMRRLYIQIQKLLRYERQQWNALLHSPSSMAEEFSYVETEYSCSDTFLPDNSLALYESPSSRFSSSITHFNEENTMHSSSVDLNWAKLDCFQRLIMNAAAVVLQRYWRGWSHRRHFERHLLQFRVEKQRITAAKKLQKAWRNYQLVKYIEFEILVQKFLKNRHKAAIIIQKNWRRFVAKNQLLKEQLILYCMKLRACAAVALQRRWRGYVTRRCFEEEWKKWVIHWTWSSMGSVVEVIGDFSDPPWQKRYLMHYCRIRECFVLVLPRKPGKYEIKFIVDGHYVCDGGKTLVKDAGGHYNNVIVVEELMESPYKVLFHTQHPTLAPSSLSSQTLCAEEDVSPLLSGDSVLTTPAIISPTRPYDIAVQEVGHFPIEEERSPSSYSSGSVPVTFSSPVPTPAAKVRKGASSHPPSAVLSRVTVSKNSTRLPTDNEVASRKGKEAPMLPDAPSVPFCSQTLVPSSFPSQTVSNSANSPDDASYSSPTVASFSSSSFHRRRWDVDSIDAVSSSLGTHTSVDTANAFRPAASLHTATTLSKEPPVFTQSLPLDAFSPASPSFVSSPPSSRSRRRRKNKKKAMSTKNYSTSSFLQAPANAVDNEASAVYAGEEGVALEKKGRHLCDPSPEVAENNASFPILPEALSCSSLDKEDCIPKKTRLFSKQMNHTRSFEDLSYWDGPSYSTSFKEFICEDEPCSDNSFERFNRGDRSLYSNPFENLSNASLTVHAAAHVVSLNPPSSLSFSASFKQRGHPPWYTPFSPSPGGGGRESKHSATVRDQTPQSSCRPFTSSLSYSACAPAFIVTRYSPFPSASSSSVQF